MKELIKEKQELELVKVSLLFLIRELLKNAEKYSHPNDGYKSSLKLLILQLERIIYT